MNGILTNIDPKQVQAQFMTAMGQEVVIMSMFGPIRKGDALWDWAEAELAANNFSRQLANAYSSAIMEDLDAKVLAMINEVP